MSVVSRVLAALRRSGAEAWAWPLRTKLAAGGGALVGAVAVGWIVTSAGGCSSRADVEARVAAIAAAVQADAAQKRISIGELADRIKQLNMAATAFERSRDLGAYCETLDELDTKFEPFGGR